MRKLCIVLMLIASPLFANPTLTVSEFHGTTIIDKTCFFSYRYQVNDISNDFWDFLKTTDKFEIVTTKYVEHVDSETPKYYSRYDAKTRNITVEIYLKSNYGKEEAGKELTNTNAKYLMDNIMAKYEQNENMKKIKAVIQSVKIRRSK